MNFKALLGVSISQSSLGRFTLVQKRSGSSTLLSFNLAIEFGPVHAMIGGGIVAGGSMFQSRNRVWAGSRLFFLSALVARLIVSISQSSLGRFTQENLCF